MRVTNTGARPGKEAVLELLTNEVGRITRPVCLPKHFEKQDIEPGESRELTFTIQPNKDLSYPAASGPRLLENAARGRAGGALPLRRSHGAGGAASQPAVI